MNSNPITKIVRDISNLIDNKLDKYKVYVVNAIKNYRIGPEQIRPGAIIGPKVATDAITTKKIMARSIIAEKIATEAIEGEHLTLSARASITTSNRNLLKDSLGLVESEEHLITEYEATELLPNTKYTIVIEGYVNDGQSIRVSFANGIFGEDSEAIFDADGYAVIRTITPENLTDSKARLYNSPNETAVQAAIFWACMYKGYITSPPRDYTPTIEEINARLDENQEAIGDLLTTVSSKTTIFYQNDAPTTDNVGDLWYDTNAVPVAIYRWTGFDWADITSTALSAALSAAAEAHAVADGKIVTYAQASAPTGASVGDLWLDTDDSNKMYRWSGEIWASVQDTHNDSVIAQNSASIVSLSTSLGGKTTIFYQTSAPSATAIGDIWYDTDAIPVVIHRWDGTAWSNITDSALSAALTAAGHAQDTADGKIISFAQSTPPIATSIGDLWTDIDDNNKLYRWSGSSWVSVQDTHNDSLLSSHTSELLSISDGLNAKTTIFYQASQPTANVVGDIWYDTDATPSVRLYRWSGSNWADITTVALSEALAAAGTAQATADGKVRTFAQTTAPTGMIPGDAGDLWIDTDDNNKLYRYSGSAWVAVQDTHNDSLLASHSSALSSLSTTINSKTTIYYQISQPTATATGDIWYDSDENPVKIYRWSGSAWTDITSDALDSALTAAADAQASADGKIRSFSQTTAPTGMVAGDVGDLWIDTDDNNKLYRYSGTAWVAVQDTHNDATLASHTGSISSLSTSLNAKTTIFYQSSQPTAIVTGDVWYDTDASPITIMRWSGSAWVDITSTALSQALTAAADAKSIADGKIVTFAQTTPPTAKESGDLWIDTDDNNKLYRWTGFAWTSIQDGNIASISTAISNLTSSLSTRTTIFYQTSQPTATATGDVWYDTDATPSVKIYRWSGSAWVDITTSALASALSAAADAKSTADGKIVTFAQTSAPTATAIGDLWVDTDDNNKLYRWNGSSWATARDTALDGRVSTVETNYNGLTGTMTTIARQTAYTGSLPPTTPTDYASWINTGVTPPEQLKWTGNSAIMSRSYANGVGGGLGKNLLPNLYSKTVSGVTFTVQANGSVLVQGTASAAINTPLLGEWGSSVPFCWLPPGTYTSTQSAQVSLDIGYATTTHFTRSAPTKTFTVPTPLSYAHVLINSGAVVNTTIYPQLEVGSAVTAYETYVAKKAVSFNDPSDNKAINVTVKTVATQSGTGTASPTTPRAINGNSVVKVKRTGKNIADPLIGGATYNGVTFSYDPKTQEFTMNGTCTANNTCWSFATMHIPISSAHVVSAHYVSGSASFVGSSNVLQIAEAGWANGGGCALPTSGISFKATNAARVYENFSIRVDSGTVLTNYKFKMQIEIGSTVSSWESYSGITYQLVPLLPLYGLPNMEDEIGSYGKETRRTVFAEYNGSESWTVGTLTGTNTMRFSSPVLTTGQNSFADGLCSHLGNNLKNGLYSSDAEGWNFESNRFNVRINKTRLPGYTSGWTDAQSLDAYKTLLGTWKSSNTPLQMLAALSSPTTATTASVVVNATDGANYVTSDGSSVVVEYTGSGWEVIGGKANSLYASATQKFDADGLRIDQTLIDGTNQKEVYTRIFSSGFGIYDKTTDSLIGGLILHNGEAHLFSTALADPRVSSDFAVNMETEETNWHTDFGMVLKNGTENVIKIVEREAGDSESEIENFAYIDGCGHQMWFSTGSNTDAEGYNRLDSSVTVYPDGGIDLFTYDDTDPLSYKYAYIMMSPENGVTISNGTLSNKDEFDSHGNPIMYADFSFRPKNYGSSTSQYFGNSTYRWERLYCRASPDVSSDERIKQDIEPIENATDLLMRIPAYKFRMKDDPSKLHYGTTWQRVRDALLSSGITDAAILGEEANEDEAIHGLLYGEFTGLLLAGIHEQHIEIENLKEISNQLKEKIAELEMRLSV